MSSRFIKGPKLKRRTFLRGAAGMALALPVLDAMLDDNGRLPSALRGGRARAQADGLPRRYAVVFAGQALGADQTQRDRIRINNDITSEQGHFIVPGNSDQASGVFTPSPTGPLTSTTPLRALANLGLLGDVSLVSGLNIPFVRGAGGPGDAFLEDGSDVPSEGAFRDFHGGGASPLLSGMRSTSSGFRTAGPSSDQLVQQALNAARGGTPRSSIVLRAQPRFYLSGFDFSGREFISYTTGGNQGRIAAQTNHQVAWQSLFGNFVPPDDLAASALVDFNKRKRLSVLDLVTRKRDTILGKVGAADRIRLERHFDELRALELRVAAIPPPITGTCGPVDDPGADNVIGADNEGSGSDTIQQNTGYSDEETRTRVMMDLIHMAFVCDLNDVATMQITAFQSHMNITSLFPQLAIELDKPGAICRADLHECGHNGDGENKGQFHVSAMLYWHLKLYGYLLQKLKDTPEGDGTVLDRSSIVFMPEAGHGQHLNGDDFQFATHSVEDMVLLVGGRAGGLNPGRHIQGNGAHPGKVLLAAMQGAGYPDDVFGEVNGAFTELFS